MVGALFLRAAYSSATVPPLLLAARGARHLATKISKTKFSKASCAPQGGQLLLLV